MDVPSPYRGKVKDVSVKNGDKVSQGSKILILEIADKDAGEKNPQTPAPEKDKETEPLEESAIQQPDKEANKESLQKQEYRPPPLEPVDEKAFAKAHASPSVRRFARELGADLGQIQGSGPKNRILKEDVQHYVKSRLSAPQTGFSIPPMPAVDFSKFGETETRPLSRIQKISATNLQRNWMAIPHVTQFDESDITDLDAFRKQQKLLAEKQDIKLTLLPFIMKACIAALKRFPDFNSSLHQDGEHLIVKKYFHIGVAVDTKEGLLVPVVRDVDQKGVLDLALELMELSAKARDKRLTPGEMQGACFSISNLGGVGGTAFTPIINAPEVAILGVSRSSIKPLYIGGEFKPRLMLPLSLSYDHRVIDGAKAARFSTYLCELLGDMRKVLL
jgi:pyruvate dehydrogenase E2 component (dihydrolipoamide acetyltransferase)